MSIALALIGMLIFQSPAASEVTTTDLDTNPSTWDDRMVTVTGEIIGDYGQRTDVVWIQVNDDGYVAAPLVETNELDGTNTGMGVRMPADLFDPSWGAPGGYATRGPVVRITGLFRYADADTGGDTFIDAVAIELLEPSRPLVVPGPDWMLIGASLAAIAAGAGLWGRARWQRRNPET